FLITLAAWQVALGANPRSINLPPQTGVVESLEQNWSDAESNWFYNVPQGSRLLPYDWFLHLEQANGTEKFRAADHIRALGFIPRLKDSQNPDGLPVGFVKDAAYDDGTPGLGLTCAACHTSMITHKGTALVIDGGPGMGDLEQLLRDLA